MTITWKKPISCGSSDLKYILAMTNDFRIENKANPFTRNPNGTKETFKKVKIESCANYYVNVTAISIDERKTGTVTSAKFTEPYKGMYIF